MLVHENMKLIHYVDERDQLFNLSSDPEELVEIDDPILHRKMLKALQKIIPVNKVAKRVDKYNKAAFKQWKERLRKYRMIWIIIRDILITF